MTFDIKRLGEFSRSEIVAEFERLTRLVEHHHQAWANAINDRAAADTQRDEARAALHEVRRALGIYARRTPDTAAAVTELQERVAELETVLKQVRDSIGTASWWRDAEAAITAVRVTLGKS